ncbi:hypothetical protein D1007_03423 [Hordeum vulgare]|nr:hypothetical protein D1007_03423 [Hordeum vulgare]
MVAKSLDKALELFAINRVDANLHLDLNRVAFPIVDEFEGQHEALQEENNKHDDDENDDVFLHDNNLGDLDKYYMQEIMDHSIPYKHGYALESDDDGPSEEVDEEGFTAKEAKSFKKVLGRDHRTPLFEDLSLEDKAVVDDDKGILLRVRPTTHRDKHGKKCILLR